MKRKLIVPKAPEAARQACGAGRSKAEAPASSRIAWAELIKRVFVKDVLECPRCGDA